MGQHSAILTETSAKVLELIEDGDWHANRDVCDEVMKYVPPGKAYRRGEVLRLRPDKRKTPGPRRGGGDDTDSIAVGARSYAQVAIENHYQGGRLEKDLDNNTIRITQKGLDAHAAHLAALNS